MTRAIPLAFDEHDHGACCRMTLDTVRAVCAREGLRLTPIRAQVMEILLESHRAMGAYEVLSRLTGQGLNAQPPVAYRALDFLVTHGFAHRIERLGAYVACAHAGDDCDPAFLICRKCQRVAETDAQAHEAGLERDARAAGFIVERAVVELEGLCPACQTEDGDAAD